MTPLSETVRLEAERAGYIYLDDAERELLAEIIFSAVTDGPETYALAELRILIELGKRIEPQRRPEDMNMSDGLGA